MAWYLNPALTRFRNEVNQRWPRRDKRSDGTIGDAAHQATNSDHNQDPDGSVDAWDMDVDGVPVSQVINAAVKHESIQYVIYNRRITSRTWGLGTWRTYTGANPHTQHVHFNTRPSHERSSKPWFTTEEDDMATAAEIFEFKIANSYTEDPDDESPFRVFVDSINRNAARALNEAAGARTEAAAARNAVDGLKAVILAAVGQVDEAVLTGLTSALVPAIATAVAEAVGDVPQETLEAAVESGVRNVLGSLDAPGA